MSINFAKWWRNLFGGGSTPAPTPPVPVLPFVFFYVQDAAGIGIVGAKVTLTLDNGSPPVVIMTDPNGLVAYQTTIVAVGLNVRIEKDGFYTQGSRRLIPTVSTYGPLPEWPSVNVLVPTIPAKKPLPPVPTREQVCSIKMSLQGLTYQTLQYGAMPGVFFWSSYADRKTSVFPAHRAAGDTHLVVGISGSYNEPSTVWPPEITKGGDNSKNLRTFKDQILEVILEGFFVDVALSGDGESIADATGYNDPVGSTYGYQWLMNNLVRILKSVRGDADSECPDGIDLTPYCIFRPGWDGVFYGWEPAKTKLGAFGTLFRSVLPNGYLAVEHNTGHIPAGEGDGDWTLGGCMSYYDTLLTEFDAPLKHNDNVFQIAARTLGPEYKRPADQPASDDPGSPPWYLRTGSARGPYFVVAFEYDAYHWSRGQIMLDQVQKDREYLQSVGYKIVC